MGTTGGRAELKICRKAHRAITFFDSTGECPMCNLIKANQELEEEKHLLEMLIERQEENENE